jgi:hypothetical protein
VKLFTSSQLVNGFAGEKIGDLHRKHRKRLKYSRKLIAV